MTYYQPADFNIFNNIYCSGQIQYLESGTGNHVDLVGKVLQNITDTATKVDLTTAQTIAGIKTFSSPPVMSGASITTGTIPTTAVSGGICDLTNAQTVAGIKTFSSPPVMSGASITSGTTPVASVSGTAVNLNTAQTITAIKTFTAVPVLSGASITTGTIPIASVVGTAMDLTTSQTVAGTKTFSTAPAMSGASITSGTIPVASVSGTAVNLNTAQTITAIKTFTAVPVLSGASITTGTIPIASVVGTAMDLTTAQTVGGIKKISSPPVMSGASITSSTIPAAAISGGICDLTTTQTVAGIKTFSAAHVLSSSLRLDGNLLANGGLTTVSNNALSKVRYLENATSDIQNQLNSMVSVSAVNTFSNTNYFNGDVYFANPTSFSNTISASSIFYSYYGNNAIGSNFQLVTTGNRSWSSGIPANGDNAYEISFQAGGTNAQGFSIQGGVTNSASTTQANQKPCFGFYFRTFSSPGVEPNRTPILYSTDTLLGAASNTLICPSSFQLNGGLVLNNGTQTLSNATLQRLQYVSTASSDLQVQISTLATKNTDISFVASPAVTSVANKLQASVLAFSTSLNGISTTVFNYISGLTSDLSATLMSLSSSITTINTKLPVGSIMQHPKGNIGSPWLLANGAAVSRTTYSALFASYGTLYGSGDGSSTFNLPNFQACFLRSYGSGVTIGSSTYSTAGIGFAQNDAIQGHNHSAQSGQFLSTSTSTTSLNGYASLAVQKPTASNFGNSGGVINANSGSETVPTHHVVYTYILAL